MFARIILFSYLSSTILAYPTRSIHVDDSDDSMLSPPAENDRLTRTLNARPFNYKSVAQQDMQRLRYAQQQQADSYMRAYREEQSTKVPKKPKKLEVAIENAYTGKPFSHNANVEYSQSRGKILPETDIKIGTIPNIKIPSADRIELLKETNVEGKRRSEKSLSQGYKVQEDEDQDVEPSNKREAYLYPINNANKIPFVLVNPKNQIYPNHVDPKLIADYLNSFGPITKPAYDQLPIHQIPLNIQNPHLAQPQIIPSIHPGKSDLEVLSSLIGKAPNAQLQGLNALLDHQKYTQPIQIKDHTPIKEDVVDVVNTQVKPNVLVTTTPVHQQHQDTKSHYGIDDVSISKTLRRKRDTSTTLEDESTEMGDIVVTIPFVESATEVDSDVENADRRLYNNNVKNSITTHKSGSALDSNLHQKALDEPVEGQLEYMGEQMFPSTNFKLPESGITNSSQITVHRNFHSSTYLHPSSKSNFFDSQVVFKGLAQRLTSEPDESILPHLNFESTKIGADIRKDLSNSASDLYPSEIYPIKNPNHNDLLGKKSEPTNVIVINNSNDNHNHGSNTNLDSKHNLKGGNAYATGHTHGTGGKVIGGGIIKEHVQHVQHVQHVPIKSTKHHVHTEYRRPKKGTLERVNRKTYAAQYAFGYKIKDFHSGNNFGHEEVRNGNSAKGHYHVSLPDGRIQNVEYWADDTGYHAKVTYS